MNALVRTAGALNVVVCLIGVASVAAGSVKARLIEIQLGVDAGHVKQLLGDTARTKAAVRAIKIDYLFLVAYWAAFVALAVVLMKRGDWWVALGGAAVAAATATAALDIVENLRTSAILALNSPSDHLAQGQLDDLRNVSLAKWAASAITLVPLASLFAQSRWVVGIAAALVLVAAVGLAGLRWHPLLGAFLLGTSVLSVFIAVLFLGWPSSVARGF